MKMIQNFSKIFFTAALVFGVRSMAQSSSTSNSSPNANFDGAAFRVAFDNCAQSYGRPQRGTPPSDDFKACMKAAGFDGPPPGAHGHHHHGPPPEAAPADSNSGSSNSSSQTTGTSSSDSASNAGFR